MPKENCQPTDLKLYHPTLVQVALAVPVGDVFDYLCPQEFDLPLMGARLFVPFGSRILVGVVIDLIELKDSTTPPNKLKALKAILDTTALIPSQTLTLAKWLSTYYHYPFGETLFTMLPSLIRQGKHPQSKNFWQLSEQALDLAYAHQVLARAPKLKQRFALLSTYANSHAYFDTTTLANLGINKASLENLINKKLVEPSLPKTQTPSLKQAPLKLNPSQSTAVKMICQALNEQRYQGFLLNGITGSGKTEVYLQAIWHALTQKKQILILVPEIGLTPQTHQRFSDRFCVPILVLHSNLSDGERLAGWQACKDGSANIIIATRSALLYPFANLGLIIVDECHDPSYKQQDHLRYHATDVALYMGAHQRIPVILGSATPSLEQLRLVQTNKLYELRLDERAGNATPPRFELIDRRLHPHFSAVTNKPTAFSTPTIHAIKEHLAKGEQVLVFLNRRGYAPVLLCQACGWQADCPRCTSHLTLHKTKGELHCHHCGYLLRVPKHCPSCTSSNLETLGVGTAKLYEELHELFSNPQTIQTPYPIVQIDRDTTQKKSDWQRLYNHIHGGEPMILVGTQMLAKGHHFNQVTLVVVVDADAGFLSSDFRSPEHTAQMIMQVAGRAGRGDRQGRVIIQTLQPDNPLLNQLLNQGYQAFANSLLHERRQLGLPPFSHATLIEAKSKQQKDTTSAIVALKKHLPQTHPFAILAPIQPPMSKKNNYYFCQMLILSKERKSLHAFLAQFWQTAKTLPETKKVRLSLDIDPMGW